VEEEEPLRRGDTPPSPPVLSAPSAAAVLFPVATDGESRLEEKDDPRVPIRFGKF
jgi:hypothetical protein